MTTLLRTPLHDRHAALGARLVDFAGWEMPVQYPTGIIAEHLATRAGAGLFDVSHMGRFVLHGEGAVPFLQHVLTGNCEALDPLEAQYTMIPTDTGGAVDDAYLYRFGEDDWLLVVNAANREKDWEHFRPYAAQFSGTMVGPGEAFGCTPEPGGFVIEDRTYDIAMLALQGKEARAILAGLIEAGRMPEPLRNQLSVVTVRLGGDAGGNGHSRAVEVRVGRTGYTGEPLCFELFMATADARGLWDALVAAGAPPRRGGGPPATRFVSRQACRSTATSSASTPAARRSRS